MPKICRAFAGNARSLRFTLAGRTSCGMRVQGPLNASAQASYAGTGCVGYPKTKIGAFIATKDIAVLIFGGEGSARFASARDGHWIGRGS